MATQPVAVADLRLDLGVERWWRAYQLFYHADQDLLLRRLVHPLAKDLVRAGTVDRIFFVRYELGGPHVRLRWRAAGEVAATVAEAALADRAADFFARWPSSRQLAEERIRSTNRVLLDIDPMARSDDDRVHPDNSWGAAPLRFEIERYGGPQHFAASLDLFTLSTAQVLQWLGSRGEPDEGWARPAYLRLALSLAWGMAAGGTDFLALLEYALRMMGEPFTACIEQGEAVFAKRRQELVDRVRRELESLVDLESPILAGAGPSAGLAAASCCLAGELGGLAAGERSYLLASHIHMTANRLGLTNREEVYLSRLLWCAADALRREQPAAWSKLWRDHSGFAARARRRPLAGWIAAGWAELTA